MIESRRATAVWIVASVAVLAAAMGASALAFECDDAYIAYRYADHAVRGWGLTWNPPPFAPVEGYTSWGWVTLLAGVWRLTGLEPPQVANALELGLAAGALLAVGGLVATLELPERLRPWRPALAAVVLGGTAASPVWLTWSTGGMGTSLFTLALLGWCAAALRNPGSRGWLLVHAGWAAAAALARPEGWLAVLASIALGLHGARERPRRLWGLAPLLAVLAHLGWRWTTYGALVPNPFAARQAGWWPGAGLAHAGSFALEHGGWVVAILALAWALRGRGGALRPGAIAVVAVAGLHALAYALVLGGDHFGFRSHVHLVPLLLLAGVWLSVRLASRPLVALGLAALPLALGLPLPWARDALSRGHRDRVPGLSLPVAPHLPPGLSHLVAPLDRLEAWRVARHVGTHRAEHAAFLRWQQRRSPSREQGLAVAWEPGHPVLVESTVGWVGWVVPEVAVLDSLGLNDRVTARTQPPPPRGERHLAHERRPPPGYLDCFEPNVGIKDRALDVRPRELSEATILECEARSWAPTP